MLSLASRTALLAVVILGAVALVGQAQDPSRAASVVQADRVVAGSPKDFMEVRHVVLQGSNEAIGRALASMARERFGLQPVPSVTPFRARVQRRYIEQHYPILFERMRGVAGVFGQRLDDNAWDFRSLPYPGTPGPGCSVVHYPPSMLATGGGVVSRNYDFSTGTLRGTRPGPGELAATARPYVVEMHPDRGYASLAIYSYDLLSGVLDGINSEGLTVALLADDELMSKFPMEPAGQGAVGLGVLQVLRFLLDTCATADEAKEALLLTKQFYEFIPVHYLVADRHGRSFVWEYSQAHNREYVIEDPGKALITTNFSLHSYLDGRKPPSPERVRTVCPRYCALAERIAGQTGKVTVDFIKECQRQVDAEQPAPAGAQRPPGRTLWHALYFPEERKVQVSFYLRDEPKAGEPAKCQIIRTEYLDFTLGPRKP
jgi:hypothetical protein